MIFVTVGTHEQQFNRLVRYMDDYARSAKEEIVIQTGYCTYFPKYCTARQFFTYKEMMYYTEKARIVITHGGPSSFILPIRLGKKPIVVPRKKEYGEHVNDHQLDFCRAVEERNHTITLVEDITDLGSIIDDYESNEKLSVTMMSNNIHFNEELAKIVGDLFS